MKPLRPTQVAEFLIFILCWSIACFFAGKWMGEEQMSDKIKPCEMKKQSLDMSKNAERNFIRYWKAKS